MIIFQVLIQEIPVFIYNFRDFFVFKFNNLCFYDAYFLDAALNHDVSSIQYYSLHCFTIRKKTNAIQFFYLIDFGKQFFWSDPMPCDLAKMLSHHLQSMFEFLTPQRRPGQRPYQQMNPNQMQSRAQDNSYVDRVY